MYKNDRTIDRELILNFRKNKSDMALELLFKKYEPLVNNVWQNYYLHDMDIDDWHQEAMIVLIRNVNSYDFKRGTSFGTLYKTSLKHHLYDILRRRNAKKRLPVDKIVSYSANEDYYQNNIPDKIFMLPDQTANMKMCYEKLISKLSPMELEIAFYYLEDLINGQNNSMNKARKKFANKENGVETTVDNCIGRIKIKLRKIVKNEYKGD